MGAGERRLSRWGVSAAALSIFLSIPVGYSAFLTPAFAQTYTFSQVSIEGNERVDAASILRFAGIGRGQALSAGALNAAYQRIVESGLFEEVEIRPDGATLRIRVKEYPMINIINFEGNKRLDDEELAELITSQSRRVFSPAQAEADANTIAEVYRARGRIAATVDPKIIRRSDNRVDLVFEIAEGKVSEVERISFIGNRAFSDRRLRQVLETKQAGLLRRLIQRDTFVEDRLELDKQLLRDFYHSRGFVDAQVTDASGEVTRERDAAFLAFTVQEGAQFRFGAVRASSDLPGVDIADFQRALRVRTGSVYSPAVMENNIARLESLALQKGMTFVKVEPRVVRHDRTQRLDVEFVLVPGEKIFVERIDIEGNTTTLDHVLRRQFRTVEGDPFNPREIRQSAERIRALGFFGDAQVEAEPGSGPDQVIVNVDVEEAPTGSLNVGATFSGTTGTAFTFGIQESNFLGRGQFLGLNISTGADNVNSSLTFREPAFLGRDLGFGLKTYYNTTDFENAAYATRRVGFSPSLDFPISQSGRLALRYTLSKDRIYKVDLGRADDPDTPEDETSNGSSRILRAEEAQGAPLASALGATYTYDTRITGLNPKGGVLFEIGADIAGFGGDLRYVKTNALAMAETKVLSEEVTVRAIFEGGAVHMLDRNSRATDRFFGNGSIRGFDANGLGPRDLTADNEDALGGNLFAVARFEADFPLGLPEEYGLNGGVFWDVGSVWSLDNVNGTSGRVDDSFHPRSAIGFSLLWETPIGPLRMNFSKVLLKESYDRPRSFDLTVQTSF